MNVRVEYEATPVRHIAVQCPDCGRWYDGRDVGDQRISTDSDIYRTQFCCPVCGKIFGADACAGYANVHITECGSSTEVYKGCLRKKEVWE